MVSIDDVKYALGITGNYQDATLTTWMNEVIDYLHDSGVNDSAITSGIVARGVSDLWNYGEAGGKLSEYFMQRASQLAFKK